MMNTGTSETSSTTEDSVENELTDAHMTTITTYVDFLHAY